MAKKNNPKEQEENKLIVFQESEVRREWHNGEWYFTVVDVVQALTDSKNSRRYWSDLKRKLKKEGYNELYEHIVQLKIEAKDGKMRPTDCANRETLLRIIQSIPSPKAEPFKMWLAKLGSDQLKQADKLKEKIEAKIKKYRNQGYSEDWIKVRLQSEKFRKELTDEWKKRGVQTFEYGWLTATIHRLTFEKNPSEHSEFKGLEKKDNLRDHMTPLELVFTMLGEINTKDAAIDMNAEGYTENEEAAKKGGKAARKALEANEQATGKKVAQPTNFKQQIKAAKEAKKLKSGKTKEDTDKKEIE